MAYPCVRLPTSWCDMKGSVVQMVSVEDAVKRVMLQESAQSGKCRKCKTGSTLHSIIPESIQLPTLLVVSLVANKMGGNKRGRGDSDGTHDIQINGSGILPTGTLHVHMEGT